MKTSKQLSVTQLKAMILASIAGIKGMCKIDAESLSRVFYPHLHGDSYASHFQKFFLQFQALIDQLHNDLGGSSAVFAVSENQNLKFHSDQDLANKRKDIQEKGLQAETKLKAVVRPQNLHIVLWVFLASGLLCFSDGFYSIEIFHTAFGYSKLESWIAGALFACLLAIFSHMYPHIIALGRTRLMRTVIALSLSTFTVILFVFMAHGRNTFMHKFAQVNGVEVSYNPWLFVFSSVLLFGVSTLINYLYLPNRAELQAIRDYKELLREKRSANRTIKNIDRKLEQNNSKLADLRIESFDRLDVGRTLENLIITEAMATWNLYMDHNLQFRSDGKPSCHGEPFPFTFKTYYQRNNYLSHEN